MGHLSLKIQTSALFLKAKNAFSLHRKSSASNRSTSSSSASSPSSATPANSTVSPPLFTASSMSAFPVGSILAATNSANTTTAVVENNVAVSRKSKRSSGFKPFHSFRDRSTSPHHSKKNDTDTSMTVPAAAASATTATTPPVISINPYSSAWCPSTVATLISPLRVASSSARSKPGLDLLQSSHYSPAPNLILQPSPAVDLTLLYATGTRQSTLAGPLQRSSSRSVTASRCRTPVLSPQDLLSTLPYEIATYILHFVDMHTLTRVALVSRTWNQFAQDNEIWKNIYLNQKRWKIRIPPRRSQLASSPHSSDPQNSRLTLAAQTRPLNWKMLCHNRKKLEAKWSTVPPQTKLEGHMDSVYCVQFDHSKIVTGSRDHSIKFWDLHTLKCTDTLHGHSQSVLCLQFNEEIMVSGSSDNTIIIWDMETRKPMMRLRGHTAGVLDVCFDDQYIVSCSKDTTIKVWDVKTGALLQTMMGHRGPVNAVQLHKGHIVSASGDSMVKMWNVGTGRCIRDFIGHTRGLACVQFDGETIVSGSNDKTIMIWDASTGKCRRVLKGHASLVRTLHFENNRIVSGSYDNTVKVWDMTTGECTLNLKGHQSWVFDVQFSSSRIISTSQDKTIIVWDFAGDLDVSLFD